MSSHSQCLEILAHLRQTCVSHIHIIIVLGLEKRISQTSSRVFNITTAMTSESKSKGIAVVTGAAQGIGRAIALRLADDGYDIAVNDLADNAERLASVENEVKSKGRRTYARVTDVSVEREVMDMIDAVVETLGGIDVVSPNTTK